LRERVSAIKLLRSAPRRTHLPRDLNFFRAFVNADKIVSSSPVRLDETLHKLVELAHHVDQCSFARRLARTIDAMSCN
jgi:hypothetical protein